MINKSQLQYAFFKNKKIIFWIILILTIYLFNCFFHFNSGSDDFYYKEAENKYSFWDYLINVRYMTWSARLFPDTISYFIFHFNFNLWRVFNTIFFLLLCYSLVRLCKFKVTIYDMIIIISLIWYSSFSILDWGFFWATGSINYLWPLSIGIFILIPFSDFYLKLKKSKFNIINLLRLIMTFCLSISNEQISIFIIIIMFFYLLFIYKRYKLFSNYLFLIMFITIIGLLFMLFAPGNISRYKSEVNTWYPGFDKLPISTHIRIGFIWFYEVVILNLKFVFIILSILTFLLMKNSIWKKFFLILILVIISLLLIEPNILFNFQMINKISFKNPNYHIISKNFLFSIFPFFLWFLFLINLIIHSYVVTKKNKFILILYLAGILSCVMISFSPTLYASGHRVLCCFLVSLVLIGFYLFQKILHKYSKNKNYYLIIMCVFPCISILLFIFQQI